VPRDRVQMYGPKWYNGRNDQQLGPSDDCESTC